MGRLARGISAIGRFLKGAKGVDEVAALTSKLSDATKYVDDAGDLSKLDDLGDAGNYIVKGKPSSRYLRDNPDHPCATKPDDCFKTTSGIRVVNEAGEEVASASRYGVWKKGYKLKMTSGTRAALTPLDGSVKAARGRNLVKADKVWQPNAMRNLKIGLFTVYAGAMFGMLGTMGYVFYRAIGIVGTFSDAAETNINNWYGIGCEEDCEGDAACLETCQERGSRNMVLTGVAICGVIGLFIMSKTGSKKEKPDASDA